MEHHPTREVTIETLAGSRSDVRIIKLRGPLTINNFFAFQDLTRQLSDGRVLLIDLADVPYIDSAALGSLIGLHVSCERTSRKYALVSAGDRLKSMFAVAGVNQFLVVYESISDAEASLS